MNSMYLGVVVRAVMLMASAHGLEVSEDELSKVLNALVMAGSLAWSLYQKWHSHQKLKAAQAAAGFSATH